MAITNSKESAGPIAARSLTWTTGLGIGLISLAYFADIFIRASHKLFWFDELFTIYLCRLPDFKSTWTAVMHGADFNPPLFYLLTRGAQRLFGEGLIATRLPEVIGVWLFGVCLYIFVRRRVGSMPGLIAGLLPFFTLVQFYAYDARPPGIVLGWCGLALICWQRADEKRGRYIWLAGFALSLIAAVLTYVYAVYLLIPFGAVELWALCTRRKVNWGIVGGIAFALAVAIPVYLPLLRMYRSLVSFGGLSRGPVDVLQSFFVASMAPALIVLLLCILFFALHRGWKTEPNVSTLVIPRRDLLIAIAFACLPIFGVAGVKVSKGVFFDRYFLSSIAGYAIMLGFAARGRNLRSWIPGALAVSMLLLLLGDFGMAVRHLVLHRDFDLIEPSSHFLFSLDTSKPMLRSQALLDAPRDEDILVFREPSYLYFYRYAPSALLSRLYDGGLKDNDVFLNGYRRLATWAHLDLKTTALVPFLATHKRFLVYGSAEGPLMQECGDCIQTFLNAGYTLQSVTRDEDGVLYQYTK